MTYMKGRGVLKAPPAISSHLYETEKIALKSRKWECSGMIR